MLLCAPRIWFTASIFLKGMGKRKFRLGQHQKNEERVGRCLIVSVPRESVSVSVTPFLNISVPPTLTPALPLPPPLAFPISVPLAVTSECIVPSLECLVCNLSLLNLFPATWTIASKDPSLVLCKFQFHGCGTTINVNRTVIYCVSIDQKLNWSLSLQNRTIHFGVCSMLGLLPTLVNSCAKLKSVLDVLDVAYVCSGNSDHQFLQQWHYNASTLHGLSGKFCSVCSELMHITFSLIGNKVAVLDDSLFPEHPTVRHKQCEMLLPGDAAGHPVRCSVCATYRTSLLTMQTRRMANRPGSSSVNYRQAIL